LKNLRVIANEVGLDQIDEMIEKENEN